ncbi:asparagine synthase (glutamine-hydrolyzing) (plasmid) [Nitratireductor rhodophyticola]|uniref:asparagine synthase (glutamine-hydrolyzing) n=1 Tax=Nitratireductor rhodophyticola TaxID=2854036 RepID=A0ABS7RH16_9HYPH|nr:asparagine synthase (glutamine-hydrolyzing) [Nitratireductor rhodophyticola]MAS14622.1 asparagine synthase (glutamine-hydrolyzing) [Nitratireductor sp.]MBY8918938.1 asparagine synthase (glutamine-hydrolyzing) [Nitratireductor rhodophyticola]MEC9244029.1 asparagine synthase (glutamine-hydrolyzing) [Pseudomonadota bacterium]MBY8923007.1 asparagine synthase (glutamine-hydrolyzing) [Nitratireductor rhodophyticola]WPZ16377.1 asparagine synthase (glutamine-hydrolyzing) [Nitratireductor rhodophyti
MCGIAGFFGSTVSPDAAPALMQRMAVRLGHRGPDEKGIHSAPGIGLAHARLSVVGLADGQQPMADARGDLVISYNGEIFNYVELRERLQARGRRFLTGSDTEVILHLYDEMGTACLDELNGDFAFALWDARRRSLWLARDRMGVRPLYYTDIGGTLFFASEVKALMDVPGFVAELDPVALDQVFTLWAPIAPRTAFRSVSELPPGHMMIAQGRERMVRPWWRLEFPRDGDFENSEYPVGELGALLEDATRIRLRADVPVGAYLSGGLDSSLVTALAARLAPGCLETFSVGFRSAEHDESRWQAEVAERLGVANHRVFCGEEEIAADFPDIVAHAECPVLRTAPAPLYRLAGLVRGNGMKVALTGEGADEVFAGYDIFREAAVRRFCARQPGSVRRPLLFQRLYPYLPQLQRQSADYLARFFSAGSDELTDPLFSHRPRFRSTTAAKLFYSPALKDTLGTYDAAADLAAQLPAEFGRWHPLNQAQYLETRFLLPGYILSSQGDRVMMAHGVEGRFPFLDHRVVTFAAGLHPGLKLRGLKEKFILKEAARGLVPDAVVDRPKQPYRAPDSQTFSVPAARPVVDGALSDSALVEAGLFNCKMVEMLKRKALNGRATSFKDNTAFMGVLSTQLWHRTFAAGQPRRTKTG